VEPAIIAACKADVCVVDYSIQVENEKLTVGFITQQRIHRLLEDGSISDREVLIFYCAVRKFYECTVEYLKKWFPLKEPLLKHTSWINFDNRHNVSFNSVDFFLSTYPTILGSINKDKLYEQFIAYQMLNEKDIPSYIKESARFDEQPKKIDIFWGYLKDILVPGTNTYQYDLLFQVAELVMTIPHSNAVEERIFSLISKNKTSSRPSLHLDGTLSSLITVKTHIENPLTWKPCKQLINNTKKATKTYNQRHKKS
jgi:hypothetical protein